MHTPGPWKWAALLTLLICRVEHVTLLGLPYLCRICGEITSCAAR